MQLRRVKMRVLVHEVDDQCTNQEVKRLLQAHLKHFQFRTSVGHPYTKEQKDAA